MNRKLASIQKIVDIQPIEGADQIQVAKVLGWNVVIAKKDNFNIGDLVVYFEIDSLLPLKPEYEFLAKGGGIKKTLFEGKEIEGYRIKTIKLRGQISQGLVMPLSILFDPGIPPVNVEIKEGDDVTLVLGVHKYEIPVPAQLAGKVRGGFPGFLPKTDEPRLQAFPQILERYRNVPFFVTEKIDGSSCTFVVKHDEFHVCSRNLDLLDDEVNTLWRLAKEMDIEKKIRTANEKSGKEMWALQGEVYGEDIQANPLKVNGQKIAFFNLYDFVKGKFADFDDFVVIVESTMKLPIVPRLYDAGTEWYVKPTVDEMVALTRVKSEINPDVWIEGMVWRPIDKEMQDPELGRLSFKIINPSYLLKHE